MSEGAPCKGGTAPFIRGLLSACITLSFAGGERGLSEDLASICELGDLGPTLYYSEPQCSYLENGYNNGPARGVGWNETTV